VTFLRRLFERLWPLRDVETETSPWPQLCAPVPAVNPAQLPVELTRLLQLHNQERQRRQQPPLKQLEALDLLAGAHAVQMSLMRRLAHSGIGDGTPVSRLHGLPYAVTRVGENLAYGMPTAELVFRHWLNAPQHRVNICTGLYAHIGLGVAVGAHNDAYWCAVYAHHTPAAKHTLPWPDSDRASAALWSTEDGFVLCPAFAAEVKPC